MAHPYPPHPGMPPQGAYPYPPYGGAPVLTDPGQWSPERPEIGRPESGLRFLARVIDTMIFVVLWFLLMLTGTLISVAMESNGSQEAAGRFFIGWVVFTYFLLPILLEWGQVSLWGRSIGKMSMKLWVVRADGGGKVTAGRALVRALLYAPGHTNVINWLLPWSITNVLWQFRDKEARRCLHDKVAGTVVVRLHR